VMAQERVTGPEKKPTYLPGLSIAIIAGGKNHGMDPSIPTLQLDGRSLLSVLVDEMKNISKELLVMNGEADNDYSSLLGNGVRLVNDEYHLDTPLGAMLSAFPQISNDYVAFISCEYPFAKSQFISQLHRLAIGRSVALPLDAQSNPVPLCGVYSVRHAEEAALKAFSRKLFHPSDMLAILPEPRYVSQEEAVRFDPSLRSLTLVRSASDLSRMNDKK